MGKAVVKYMLALFAFGAKQGRTSWGDSGALYLQPATAGMNPGPRTCDVSSETGPAQRGPVNRVRRGTEQH